MSNQTESMVQIDLIIVQKNVFELREKMPLLKKRQPQIRKQIAAQIWALKATASTV